MTGTRGGHDARNATNDVHDDETRTAPAGGRHVAERTGSIRPKTSAAAAFALVFGLTAFISALTGVLAPLALLFGIVGIVLGVIGRKKGADPHPTAKGVVLTGKGVATGGLVLAGIALLVGIATVIGAVTVLVNPTMLDSVQQGVQDFVNNLTG